MSQRSHQKRTDHLANAQPGQPGKIGGINAVTRAVEMSHYSGPLPPPEILREFEEIVPGSAERIFFQFEAQSLHRRSLERMKLSSDSFSQRVGTLSASLIGFVGVGGGLWLAHEGKSVVGITALFGTIGGLVSTFLYKRRRQDRERDTKQNPQST